MRILVDIGHPAHVHMFHYVAEEMQKRGHEVMFVCRDKEFEVRLLTNFGFRFVNLGKKHKGLIGKVWDMIRFDARILWTALRFRPDVLISHGALTASQVAWLIRKPHITFEDTFNMEQVNIYAPMARVIFTAMYDNPLVGRPNVLRYSGYKELLFLHPNRFTPDVEGIRKELGVMTEEKFSIVRFVAWNATHDRGHRGISIENKVKAIQTFAKYGRVLISSEGALPPEIEALLSDEAIRREGEVLQYPVQRFSLAPERMHHAEAAASLVWGESSTMVAEAAVLGTPGVFLDNTGRLFTKDIEEHYGLCYNLTESPEDQVHAIEIGEQILSGQIPMDFRARHEQLLHEKIDVTGMFCWFIENYPESEKMWRENRPEIEERFK